MNAFMQKITLWIGVTALTLSAQAQLKTDTVTVLGNCGMCQSRIEKAAKKAGATQASWNDETQVLTVSYQAKKSNLTKIQQRVAAVGHDTRDFTAPQKVYDNLEGCCQYDRKAGTAGDSLKKTACCSSKDCGTGKDCCTDGKACCTDKSCCSKANQKLEKKICCSSKDCGTGKDCCKEGEACCNDKACCLKATAEKGGKCCTKETCLKAADCCKEGSKSCANKSCCSK